jgi:hypothetical protein
MIPLTFPDDEPQDGFGLQSSMPIRPTAKCVSCGVRHTTRVQAVA